MNNIILHIPHSSTKLPLGFYKHVIIDRGTVNGFNTQITDLYTNELFGRNKYPKIVAKFSRIYCDVEKFADDNKEVMAQFGMGFVYTHTNKGEQFINITGEYKNKIKTGYYSRYHEKLNKCVSNISRKGVTILLDCHSFSENIIMFDDKKENLPDICIGYNEMYYSKDLVDYIKLFFTNLGYKVAHNHPYSGAMIPNRFFAEKANDLYCVMIEINKNLYLDKNNIKTANFNKLKCKIQELLKKLENFNIK